MTENINLRDNDRPFFTGRFSATGRIRRLHYGLYVIIFFAAVLLLAVLGAMLGVATVFVSATGGLMVMLVMLLFVLMLYVPMFMVLVKRYHDFGWSGWVPAAVFICNFAWNIYTHIAYFPQIVENAARLRSVHYPDEVMYVSGVFAVINICVFVLIPLFVPGTKSFNRYGSNPKRPFAVQCAEAGISVEAFAAPQA